MGAAGTVGVAVGGGTVAVARKVAETTLFASVETTHVAGDVAGTGKSLHGPLQPTNSCVAAFQVALTVATPSAL